MYAMYGGLSYRRAPRNRPRTKSLRKRSEDGSCKAGSEPLLLLSWQNLRVCYRACPLPGKAMTISLLEQPTIHADKCVGCGLCEQACIHMPQAIRVVPV